MHNPDLERLLRAAAQHEKPAAEMPYGFDARIVALARAERTAETTTASAGFGRSAQIP